MCICQKYSNFAKKITTLIQKLLEALFPLQFVYFTPWIKAQMKINLNIYDALYLSVWLYG
jgi:predicted nucleic acid-binding protein